MAKPMPLFRHNGMLLLLLRGVWNYAHTIVDNFNGLPALTIYFLGLVNDYLLYKLVITFNYKDGTKEISLEELETETRSDIKGLTPPQIKKRTLIK